MTGPTAKSADRRTDILLAAAKCFREKGLRATSVADVAAEAGMSAGLLYYYFRHKDELVRAVFAETMDSVQAVFAHMAERDDVLEQLMGDYFACAHRKELLFAQDEATMIEFYAEAARDVRMQDLMVGYFLFAREKLVDILSRAQERRQLSDNADIGGMATLLGMYFAARPLAAIADPAFARRNYAHAVRTILAPNLSEPLPSLPTAEQRERMPACD